MQISMMPFKRARLFIVLIFLISTFQFAQVKGGRWMFEENSLDEASWDLFENNGTLLGTATFANNAPIVQGNYYLSLEDSADYGVITVPDQEELDFLNEDFAASVWAYPIIGYDKTQYFFIKGERSGSVKVNNYGFRINDEYFEFIVHSESGSKKVARSSFKVVNYEWNFLAVFYDYAQKKIYIWNDPESTPIDTMDFNAPLFPNNQKLYIGTQGENGFKRFWGRLDDLRISNKISDIFDNETSVEHKEHNIHPMKFTLDQNYPNPFNPETIISFSLTEQGHTRLSVYNLIGEKITNLIDEEKVAGEYRVRFNAKDLPSGVYFYKLQHNNNLATKKMLVIK